MRRQSKLVYTDRGAINIEAWLYNLVMERQKSDENLLREASFLAKLAGEDHLTPNGESCLHQGLAMAEILADLNLDDDTLAAAMVYSSVQNADLTLEDVEEHLGKEVTKLIRGTRQMDAVHSLHGKLTQGTHLASTIDNLRKMMLAMVDDVRVVLLKLAERLCILRNMLAFSEVEMKRIAKETMDIYAPLANRLGIGHLKWQLEDLAFRYLEPEEYHLLSKGLKERRVDREDYVVSLINTLKDELQKAEISDCDVTGRAKHIYSIFRKMQRKHVTLDEIYDAIAFRILVSNIEDCYSTLGIVHSLWEHIPKEFDDYIIHPKPNGYRSIHTAVIGPNDKYIEIQIRTFDMHREAELGVAAHWIYKEGSTSKTSYETKIAWLRQVMGWQKEITETQKESQEIFSNIFEDRLYVFTPNGDVIELPGGSTPLDFAYHIHTELGHRCRGAKINGSIVPLTYSLKSGEKVDILTAKQGHPSRDWLNPHLGYLKTARARAKVLNWFRKQDYDRHHAEGHDLLERELKRLGIRDVSYEELSDKLHQKSKEEMLVALGRGDLRIHNVMLAAQMMTDTPKETEKFIPTFADVSKIKSQVSDADIVFEGVENLLTYLAKCCKPVPGDQIIGYITMGRGISIHRQDCQNLVERSTLFPDRKIEVKWGGGSDKRYPVDLNVLSYERDDLVQHITALLANEHIPIAAINITHNRTNNTAMIHLTIEVDSLNPLSRLLARISQLQGVISVQRD
ncbi:MAG: GTP diphosphokinase [Gammaproteobacteria bacterium]|nr:GTP diphosphokinase [Gammaproteobacteria bacterium]